MNYSLGRIVEHDPRSRNFAAPEAPEIKSVLHKTNAPVQNQGSLGSCTGNALAQCINTTKFRPARLVHHPKGRFLNEEKSVDLYSRATVLDGFPGQWPPEDTGSSGLAVCKAGIEAGYLIGYNHAFGFEHFLHAIQYTPVIVGTWWYEDMFSPDSRGVVSVSGNAVGGHEYLVRGIHLRSKRVHCRNSWSKDWGKNGEFYIDFEDFQHLLEEDGDVTIPIPATLEV